MKENPQRIKNKVPLWIKKGLKEYEKEEFHLLLREIRLNNTNFALKGWKLQKKDG